MYIRVNRMQIAASHRTASKPCPDPPAQVTTPTLSRTASQAGALGGALGGAQAASQVSEWRVAEEVSDQEQRRRVRCEVASYESRLRHSLDGVLQCARAAVPSYACCCFVPL
jgi:hypothetical protein